MTFSVGSALVTREGILQLSGKMMSPRTDDTLKLTVNESPSLNEDILLLNGELVDGEAPMKVSPHSWQASFDLKSLPEDLYEHSDLGGHLTPSQIQVFFNDKSDTISEITWEK